MIDDATSPDDRCIVLWFGLPAQWVPSIGYFRVVGRKPTADLPAITVFANRAAATRRIHDATRATHLDRLHFTIVPLADAPVE